ncbi:MAG: PilN domain-containing protein [Bdellovibrionales bacterium]|nr:PilN domain-containing protein [Bdellovibrionales bacterium]
MIKVNLLQNRGPKAEGMGIASEGVVIGSLNKAEQVTVIKKFFMLLLSTLIIIGYEWYNVDLQTQLANQANQEMQKMERELKAKKEEMKQYADVEQESKILEEKISILKALSKVRLREVKTLDYLQSITPDSVWYKSVDYKSKTFKIDGYAITDDALSALIKELESSIYFTDVILMKASEEKQKNGTVKAFEVQAKIGDVG